MAQRLKFECWSCERIYSLLREITQEQTLLAACPYCHEEAVVDLAPFAKRIKPVLRNGQQTGDSEETLDLPAILPTHKRVEVKC